MAYTCWCQMIKWEEMNHPESIKGSRRNHINYTGMKNIHYFRNGYETITHESQS